MIAFAATQTSLLTLIEQCAQMHLAKLLGWLLPTLLKLHHEPWHRIRMNGIPQRYLTETVTHTHTRTSHTLHAQLVNHDDKCKRHVINL